MILASQVGRLVALLAAGAFVVSATAQGTSPSAVPLRILVAYPPGGVSDAMARALAERVSRHLDVPVIVENRGGAGGVVAMEALKRAPPDGKTLVFSAVTPLTVAPLLGPVGFDPQRDVAPVMSVMATPVLVLGTRALAGDSMAAVVDMAKANPGTLRWATSGLGTTGHLVLDRVRAASGADITHVPYRGGGAQIQDALSGEFEVLSSNVGELQLQLVRNRRLKALAVGAPMRLDVLPDVPTLAEAGFPDANLASTFGLFAPGPTPLSIIAALNRAFNLALKDPELRRRLLAVGNHATGGSAEDFGAFLAREREAAAQRPRTGSASSR
jgi:tripartite-type tricarboxylate transporter receptor subunit TctC